MIGHCPLDHTAAPGPAPSPDIETHPRCVRNVRDLQFIRSLSLKLAFDRSGACRRSALRRVVTQPLAMTHAG
jgi:hypothetical protein